MGLRKQVLGIYRMMYRHLRVLPKDQASELLHEMRKGFRKHIGQTKEEKIQELIRKAYSRLGYVRMTMSLVRRPTLNASEEGVSNLVWSNGELREGYGTQETRSKTYNTDLKDWDLRRHEALQQRMEFRGPYWEGGRPPPAKHWREDIFAK